MKQKHELHPALRAQTIQEFEAKYPPHPEPQGVRPVVVCEECARLKRENEALRAVAKASAEFWRYNDLLEEYNSQSSGELVNWASAWEQYFQNEMTVRNALECADFVGALDES